MATSSENVGHDFVEVGFSDVAQSEVTVHHKIPEEILDRQDEKTFQDARLSIPLEETISAHSNVRSEVSTGAGSSETGEAEDAPQMSESAAQFGRRIIHNVATSTSAVQPPSCQPRRQHSTEEARTFFSNREGVFENAVDSFKRMHLKVEEDGEIRGAWLLTQIDHWDMEKERLVLITDNWLMLVKYDFIGFHVPEIMRIPLLGIDHIVIGEFKYPNSSIMPKRSSSSGVRAMWNNQRPASFLQNWNPWSRQIPWVNLTSHPIYWHHDRDQNTYNVETFGEALCQAIEQSHQTHGVTAAKVSREPIVIENYAGVVSAIHNVSALGFYKVRGKVSF